MTLTTIFPCPDWCSAINDSADLRFPPLIYDRIDVPFDTPVDKLLLGGSWSVWGRLPYHRERCAIFEDQSMPYRFDFLHLTVRNAVLLWPRINLSCYTQLDRPDTVYVKDRDGRFCARFRFLPGRIRLTELQI